jgi:hypothetical protein
MEASMLRGAIAALAIGIVLPACAESNDVKPTIQFAVPAPSAIRVESVRTIVPNVKVSDRYTLGFESGKPLVRFTHANDAHLERTRASVPLRDGRSLSVWTDDESGHVLAEIDGLLPEVLYGGDAVGSPHAATADGEHVVVTFAATTENGFDLVEIMLGPY